MIANHPIQGNNYSYHIRGGRSPLNKYITGAMALTCIYMLSIICAFTVYDNIPQAPKMDE